jgi:hypothetical protein
MDREDNICRKNLNELDLTGLGELCANVARNVFANSKQSATAHVLRMEWVRLILDRLMNGDKTEAKESLKKRMGEFLAGVPSWMLSGA